MYSSLLLFVQCSLGNIYRSAEFNKKSKKSTAANKGDSFSIGPSTGTVYTATQNLFNRGKRFNRIVGRGEDGRDYISV